MTEVVTTLSELPQSVLEKWRLVLSYHYNYTQDDALKEIAEAINESLELKQLNRLKGLDEEITLGI